ncbi:MAG: hypothetical protein IKY96_01295 [Oscillospiraceae bacterium]|nr:hypothetical protein [Oscillospiraceae bacterium]
MGISILEQVLRRLRNAEFQADAAFPGQKYPQLTKTAAAVHIEKVDRANMTVTLEVNIISPAALGGTACELEALRATEVLQWDGAVCVQQGCSYDGAAQVYVVAILATYNCVTEADSCTFGPGFEVYINDNIQHFAVSFEEEEARDYNAEFSMGEPEALGISTGSRLWNITLEEHIMPGSPEAAEPKGDFILRIERPAGTETFYQCRWRSIRRVMDKTGLRRIRRGISTMKEVN